MELSQRYVSLSYHTELHTQISNESQNTYKSQELYQEDILLQMPTTQDIEL